MSVRSSFWIRRSLTRRALLSSAGHGVTGLAGAALIGCGGGNDNQAAATAGAKATSTGAAPATSGDLRIPPGLYESSVPPTAAGRGYPNPGEAGGTLRPH